MEEIGEAVVVRVAQYLPDFITQVEEVYEEFDRANESGPTEPIFRGHGRSDWRLRPLLYRDFDASHDDIGRSLLTEFKQAALPHVRGQPREDLSWMIIAQHHGLATRLLDWTESALHALHFALDPEHDEFDAAVWCLNPRALNALVDLEGRIVFDDRSFPTWDPPLKSIYDCYSEGGDPAKKAGVAVFHPPALSPRITAQKACFTLFGNEPTALEGIASTPSILQAIRIPKGEKFAIRQQLEMAGVTSSSVFPDLDGIAEEVMRRERRRRGLDQWPKRRP